VQGQGKWYKADMDAGPVKGGKISVKKKVKQI
jgi:hypothetical protein